MKASELITKLQALQHQGDLEVVVIDEHGHFIELKNEVGVGRFTPSGPDIVIVLQAEGY